MTYELLKQLKEAGFPLTGFTREVGYVVAPDLSDKITPPTLSELIAACGDIELVLKREPNGKWWATRELEKTPGGDTTPFEDWHNEGKTPEEAVGKLWLALNKK
jgi:hypothetical protein